MVGGDKQREWVDLINLRIPFPPRYKASLKMTLPLGAPAICPRLQGPGETVAARALLRAVYVLAVCGSVVGRGTHTPGRHQPGQ
jgi:hypothetical protein